MKVYIRNTTKIKLHYVAHIKIKMEGLELDGNGFYIIKKET